MTRDILIGGLFIILGLLMIVGIINILLLPAFQETHVEQVHCYDRHGNEIQGLNCNEVVFDNYLVESVKNTLPIFVILIMILGIIINLMGVVLVMNGIFGGEIK